MIEEPDEHGHNRLVVKGDTDTLSSIRPYWLCLDEMNLAPVEQYFADYLSVIETRKWEWQGSVHARSFSRSSAGPTALDALIAGCPAYLGVLLADYSTADIARDRPR